MKQFRTLTNFGRINNLRYDRLPTRCGRGTCHCLIRLDLKDKKGKKFYNDCYSGWYNFYMRNKLELF